MRRGEVWWAELPPPIGHRPVVLLSRNEAYRVRELVIVAPVTTTTRHIPAEVPLSVKDGLPKSCVVNLDTLMTIRKAKLTKHLASLRPEKLDAINEALKFSLAIP